MKWLSSFPFQESEVDPVLSRPYVQAAPGFALLCRQLTGERKLYVLDLGPALAANVEFFSRFPCRIFIEDLYETLASFDYLSPEDGLSYETVFRYLLPYPSDTRFDAILGWDLFNYLEKPEVTALVAHLRKFSRRGTLLYALISTNKQIPDKPLRFRILDSQNLQYESLAGTQRACPCYQQTDLDQIFTGFQTAHSFVLRSGMKEFLMVRS